MINMPRGNPSHVSVGDRYGRLVVTARKGSDRHGRSMWLCVCDCGGNTVTSTSLLRNPKRGTRSCGCLQKQKAKNSTKHGMCDSPEYRAWAHIKERCLNPHTKHFNRYGGRGILISEEWLDFRNFIHDMGRKPSGSWIERRLNNGPYSKDNCYWATPEQQSRNKSSNIRIVYDGRVQIVTDWAKESGIAASTIMRRLNHLGWTVKQALETAPYQRCV